MSENLELSASGAKESMYWCEFEYAFPYHDNLCVQGWAWASLSCDAADYTSPSCSHTDVDQAPAVLLRWPAYNKTLFTGAMLLPYDAALTSL